MSTFSVDREALRNPLEVLYLKPISAIHIHHAKRICALKRITRTPNENSFDEILHRSAAIGRVAEDWRCAKRSATSCRLGMTQRRKSKVDEEAIIVDIPRKFV